ncbi:hypothetical protein B0H15DRAFT_942138 [Mycena belliarum]|uniref:Uncharacterized protein n=1 Tax=Mycena belliarum TaxID=1033014 RepID=A0AAD6ULJ1_9AGAR|nr:hypothetical protein B0H15DRAFT_942138 [Mycena belliae]
MDQGKIQRHKNHAPTNDRTRGYRKLQWWPPLAARRGGRDPRKQGVVRWGQGNRIGIMRRHSGSTHYPVPSTTSPRTFGPRRAPVVLRRARAIVPSPSTHVADAHFSVCNKYSMSTSPSVLRARRSKFLCDLTILVDPAFFWRLETGADVPIAPAERSRRPSCSRSRTQTAREPDPGTGARPPALAYAQHNAEYDCAARRSESREHGRGGISRAIVVADAACDKVPDLARAAPSRADAAWRAGSCLLSSDCMNMDMGPSAPSTRIPPESSRRKSSCDNSLARLRNARFM